ncbi:hypothetical protein D3C85_1079780 [compost metagenome]
MKLLLIPVKLSIINSLMFREPKTVYNFKSKIRREFMLQFRFMELRKMKSFLKPGLNPQKKIRFITLIEKMQIKLSLITTMRFRNTIKETTGNH